MTTTNPIAVYIPPEEDRGNPIRDPAALAHAKDVARELAEADLIPPAFRGKPANVLLAVILAYRLGEDPLYVLQSMSVISGRPCWSAQFVIARANKAGIFKGPIRWREQGDGDGLAVTAYATVAETGDEVAFTVTMEMARADGWAGRNAKYKTLPSLMLRYRAAVLLVRLHAPEVLAGYHEREELIDSGIGAPALPERDPDPAASAAWGRPPAIEAEIEPANPSPSSPTARGEPAASEGDQPWTRDRLLARIKAAGRRLPPSLKEGIALRAGVDLAKIADASIEALERLASLAEAEVARRDLLRPDVVALQDRAADLLREIDVDSALRILADLSVETVDATHDPETLERLVEALDRALEEASAAAQDDGEDAGEVAP